MKKAVRDHLNSARIKALQPKQLPLPFERVIITRKPIKREDPSRPLTPEAIRQARLEAKEWGEMRGGWMQQKRGYM